MKNQISIITVFIWIGFVCSISFMEAWLKFRAPLVTVPVGLSIGRLIFDVLNKVEWVFAIIITGCMIFTKQRPPLFHLVYFFIPIAILGVQTFVFLPALNARVEAILQGQPTKASLVHFYYIATEAVKVGCLAIFGVRLFR